MEQMELAGLMARREAQLALLTGGVVCYDVGLIAETPRAEVVQTILQLVPRHFAASGAGMRPKRR
jgi:hypothetical protein